MTETVYAFIFARGGSQGLPGKNIRPLAGKPLLGWAIETARAVPTVSRIFVSTDDPQIAAVARDFQAEVIDRPAELASNTASEWLAWRHAIQAVGVDCFNVFLSVPATAPLRNAEDVSACVERLRTTGCDAVITCSPAARHPMFNMITTDPDGNACLVMPTNASITRRQDAPTVFDMTTVAYALRPQFILSHNGLFEGRVQAVEVPRERAVDIDDAVDFALAEVLLQQRSLS